MWKKLKRGYRWFINDHPGHRFLNTYERWKDSGKNVAAHVAIIVAGLLLIVIGILLALVPGVPGIVLGVMGMALIATRFRWMAICMDWIEIKCRKALRKLRRLWRTHHQRA